MYKKIGLKITLLTSEQVLNLSNGKILNSKTLNYKDFYPELGGLFCDRIFGTTSKTCFCGKIYNYDNLNFICKTCGVETFNDDQSPRRNKYGYIKFSNYFINPLYYKLYPHYISLLLDIPLADIEKILYESYYIVIFSNLKILKVNSIIDPRKYLFYKNKYYNLFYAETGVRFISYILRNIDINNELNLAKINFKKFKNKNNGAKYKKRYIVLRTVNNFKINLNNLTFNKLLVMPPDLRPIIKLPNDTIVSSDLNELYKKIVNSSLRLKKIYENYSVLNDIINNEKKVLQKYINNLFLKNKENNLKSLSENLIGKQGFFRKNLLGKRVDYSARGVIVSGPELSFGQCGMPISILSEILRPFVYNKILLDKTKNIRIAKLEVDLLSKQALSIIYNIIKDFYILLNRAPTLHRLSIQSFKPVITFDKVIKLHPLTCQSFNADFDGDQMAVHLPLSFKSNLELKKLTYSGNNIIYPSNGEPCILPNKDIILGLYYYTRIKNSNFNSIKIYNSLDEVLVDFQNGVVKYNTLILLRFKLFDNLNVSYKIYKTILSRSLIYKIFNLHCEYNDFNKNFNKEEITNIFKFLINNKYDFKKILKASDNLMRLGFHLATLSGFSFSLDDIIINYNKNKVINKVIKSIILYNLDYLNLIINRGIKKKKIMDLWDLCSNNIFNLIIKELSFSNFIDSNCVFIKNKSFKNLYIMINSGARGSEDQLKQICCDRGFIGYKGEGLMETPVVSSLKEGLSVFEYFYFSHNSRKTLADTAIKTSKAGYLTRKLVESSNNTHVSEFDCKTKNGLIFKALINNGDVIKELNCRIFGRTVLEDIVINDIKIRKNTIINDEVIKIIKNKNISFVKLRSTTTCEAKKGFQGVCSLCYGVDLSKNKIVDIGEMVGIIAAQSIGEPGTQLTMRTFHKGGAISRFSENSFFRSNFAGYIKYDNMKYVVNENNIRLVTNNLAKINICDKEGFILEYFTIPRGSYVFVEQNKWVDKNELICKWDSNYKIILSNFNGYLEYSNLKENLNFTFKNDIKNYEILNSKENPELNIYDDVNKHKNLFKIKLDAGDIIINKINHNVNYGDIILKKNIVNNFKLLEDIVDGLPKIDNLFEVRVPKICSLLAPVSGILKINKLKNKLNVNIVDNEKNIIFSCIVSNEDQLTVFDGENINMGDKITEGSKNLNDILSIHGKNYFIDYFIREVQKTYNKQAVNIDDKHIEIIISRMLDFIIIKNPKTTDYITGEIITFDEVCSKNKLLSSINKILYNNVALGVTDLSLRSKSFLSAASFQRTNNILSQSALKADYDDALSLKTSIMLGNHFNGGSIVYKKILK